MLVVNPSGLIIAEFRGEVQANYLNKFIPACFKYYANELDHSNKSPSFCSSSLELNSPSSLSSLNFPSKLCMDQTKNVLFVSDSGNNRVLGINTNTNKVELTIGNGERGCANGSFSSSRFDWPQGLAFDSNKNLLYIADTFNDLIRVADLNTKEVSTLCGAFNNEIGSYDYKGGKEGKEQTISSPWDLCLLNKENSTVLLIACAGTHQIWLYSFKNESITDCSLECLSWWNGLKIEWNTLIAIGKKNFFYFSGHLFFGGYLFNF